MDIGSAMPDGASITALLFVTYCRFKVNDADAGVLLCIGITKSELEFCMQHGSSKLIDRLKDANVYPYTVTHRDSVIE